MLNDYKGEKPNNVITEEEHKKRPFYKKVSFWVLSALGLFFGGCSVYGLVLGYQYVHAVTEAAHIIADAQTSDSGVLSKNKNLLPTPFPYDSFTFSFRNEGGFEGTKVFRIDTGAEVDISNSPLYVPCFRITCSSSSAIALCIPFAAQNNTQNICLEDYIDPWSHNQNAWNIQGFYHYCPLISSSNPFVCSGTFHFKPYTSGYTNGHQVGYDQGYQEGSQDGYQDGYQEGYDDGSDAINLPQSVKVLLPVGNEYSVQYKSYVDGVVDRQGQLNSSQTGGAYATFDRSRTQKLRIDLTLPTGSRAFFLYTPSWTASYPTDENYSLRQSWAVSGVTYLPTWVSKPQIYVGVTSADVPDLTYETISFAFDVDHWGDIKVGAYSQGYNDGYQAGQEDPTAYDSGYDAGYEQGYDDGHTLGVAQGESQAVSGQKALVNMFVTAFQQPFDQIYRFLNFNVLGLNILALFTALLTLSIGIIIIKKVI